MNCILVLNSGSSSLKFGVYPVAQDGPALYKGQVRGVGSVAELKISVPLTLNETLETSSDDPHADALGAVLSWLEQHARDVNIVASGHRIVHGGREFAAPLIVDEQALQALSALTPLAPLHQPHNLAALVAICARLPAATHIACFDTAFHRSQPELARRFALPRTLHDDGVQRYGFHGLSYEYVAGQLPAVLGDAAHGSVVIAHLGAGSSLCALRDGRNMATTMGFTALDGLMMGTRCGSLDPGVLLYLMQEKGMDEAALTRLLYHESGLLGVSGESGEMQAVLGSASATAEQAVALYCYRAAREIGSMMCAAGGFDALVFTGGIGEHAAAVRSAIVEHLHWAGAAIEPDANARHATDIGLPDSPVRLAVIPTDEEGLIASHVRRLLA